MKHLLGGLLIGVFVGNPFLALAYSGVATNPLLQEKPVWFAFDTQGGMYGETEGGHTFTQKPVVNDQAIKIHKFTIGTAFYYISDRGVIEAPSDLVAMSIYFSLG